MSANGRIRGKVSKYIFIA